MNKIKVAGELIQLAKTLIAKEPKKGDEVRYKGSDGAMTVDKVHSIDDGWVELNRGDMVKMKDMTSKGKYWLARKIS